MRLALLMAITMAALTVTAEPKNEPPKAREQKIEQLIKELGADKFAVRKKAREKLKTLGSAARKQLLKHQDTKDPEIRASIQQLLLTLRWQIIPGAEAQIKSLVDELNRKEDGKDMWAEIAKQYPVRIIDLIIEISRDPKLRQKIQVSMYPFLMNAPPIEAAQHIRQLPADERRILVTLIDKAYLDLYETKKEQMFLFFCLDDYRRTIARARQYWAATQNPIAIDIAAVSAARSKDLNEIWAKAGELCLGDTNASSKCRKLSFYVGIAKRLNMPHVARSLMRLNMDGLDKCSPVALQKLISLLDDMGMTKVTNDLLNGRQDPWLMYQFLYRFNKQMGAKMQEADLKKVMAAATTDEQLLRLASNVLEYNVEHAMAALERIISTPPAASVFDTRARYMMAQIEEDRAHFVKAAEHLEEYAKLRAKGNAAYLQHIKAVQAHAAELRNMASMVTPEYVSLMEAGYRAYEQKKDDEAIKAYKKAIEVVPEISIPYQKLIAIYRKQEHYGPYREAVNGLLKQKPITTRDLALWAGAYADIMMLDEAEKAIELFRQKSSADYTVDGVQAQVDERREKFDKAIEFYSKTGNATSHRQVGLLLLKQNKDLEGVKKLQTHLLYNPFDEYGRLWLFIGRARLKIDDRESIGQYIDDRHLSSDAWATKLLMYYAGRLSREKLLAAAGKDDQAIRPAQLCEAQFYIAELDRINGKTGLATKGFKDVMSHNIPMYIEHHWAALELKKMANGNNLPAKE